MSRKVDAEKARAQFVVCYVVMRPHPLSAHNGRNEEPALGEVITEVERNCNTPYLFTGSAAWCGALYRHWGVVKSHETCVHSGGDGLQFNGGQLRYKLGVAADLTRLIEKDEL